MTIELNEDDALVLFDFLARHDELDNVNTIEQLNFEDRAERYALWQLHGALERKLLEPFKADYQALVSASRAAVRARWGDE